MINGVVTTRDARLPEDADFLLSVFASTKVQDLELMGWPGGMEDPGAIAFVTMQHDARDRQYASDYPDASSSIVLLDGEPVGRILVDRSAGDILIVDIALLSGYRTRGIGRCLVTPLLHEADGGNARVTCFTPVDGGALPFWEHLGFEVSDTDGVYAHMVRTCGT